MKDMKNVKPAYATKLGTGVFVGMAITYTYECRYCHKRKRAALGIPQCKCTGYPVNMTRVS